jgi:hypothetical protein
MFSAFWHILLYKEISKIIRSLALNKRPNAQNQPWIADLKAVWCHVFQKHLFNLWVVDNWISSDLSPSLTMSLHFWNLSLVPHSCLPGSSFPVYRKFLNQLSTAPIAQQDLVLWSWTKQWVLWGLLISHANLLLDSSESCCTDSIFFGAMFCRVQCNWPCCLCGVIVQSVEPWNPNVQAAIQCAHACLKKIGLRPKDSGNKMSVIFLFLLCLGLCVPQLSYIAQVQVFTFDVTACFLKFVQTLSHTMTTRMS